MVEHWYSVVYVADHRCTTIIQIHHLSVKFLNVTHYLRNFKEQFSTGVEKNPLLVRTFGSELSTGFEKSLIYLQKKYPHSHPVQKISFQMVAEETKLFMRASVVIFKMRLQVVADGIGVLGSDLKKISPSGSRREGHF